MQKQEKPPSQEELLSYLAELAHDYGASILVGQPADKQVPATFTIVSEGLKTNVYACPWKDDQEKKEMILEVAKTAAISNARAWSFISESWMAVHKPERPFIRPMERPDRKEALIVIVGRGTKHENHLYSWDIIRDQKSGRVTRLGGQQPEPGMTQSWIADIMNAAVDFAREHPLPEGPL